MHETESIAAELARTLTGGEVIALYGDLGAGKTQFTRGLVMGLGGDGHDVSSPTFVLLNVYETPRLKVFHLDAYRVSGADDFDAIGFSELLEQGGVVVIEWPTRVEDLLPRAKAANASTSILETISAHGRRIRSSGCWHSVASLNPPRRFRHVEIQHARPRRRRPSGVRHLVTCRDGGQGAGRRRSRLLQPRRRR